MPKKQETLSLKLLRGWIPACAEMNLALFKLSD
jgi:hypothetical protein